MTFHNSIQQQKLQEEIINHVRKTKQSITVAVTVSFMLYITAFQTEPRITYYLQILAATLFWWGAHKWTPDGALLYKCVSSNAWPISIIVKYFKSTTIATVLQCVTLFPTWEIRRLDVTYEQMYFLIVSFATGVGSLQQRVSITVGR